MDFLFINGTGKRPSELRYSSGMTANSKAITRLTVMMKRLSVVKKSPDAITLTIAKTKKASATSMQMRLSSPSSLFIRIDYVS